MKEKVEYICKKCATNLCKKIWGRYDKYTCPYCGHTIFLKDGKDATELILKEAINWQ